MIKKKKKKRTRTQKKIFLPKLLTQLLLRQNMKMVDIAENSLISASTLSNVFSGQRQPSDELLYAIGKGMKLTKNEIAKLLLFLAQDRTIGSANELWFDILKSLESPDSRGFQTSNVGNQDRTGSFIPIYETAWPGIKPGEIQGSQIGIFPYWEEKAKNGAFGLLVPDDSMDGPNSFLKATGLAVFETQINETVPFPFGNVFCVHLPGSDKCKIRRIFEESDGKIVFHPDNPHYQAISLTRNSEENFFFGVLAGFWKYSS